MGRREGKEIGRACECGRIASRLLLTPTRRRVEEGGRVCGGGDHLTHSNLHQLLPLATPLRFPHYLCPGLASMSPWREGQARSGAAVTGACLVVAVQAAAILHSEADASPWHNLCIYVHE